MFEKSPAVKTTPTQTKPAYADSRNSTRVGGFCLCSCNFQLPMLPMMGLLKHPLSQVTTLGSLQANAIDITVAGTTMAFVDVERFVFDGTTVTFSDRKGML